MPTPTTDLHPVSAPDQGVPGDWLFEHAPLPQTCAVVTPDGALSQWRGNVAWHRLFEGAAPWVDPAVHAEFVHRLIARSGQGAEGVEPLRREMALTDRQGRERQMLVKAHLLPVDGQTMLLAGYLDITKQRAAVMASIGEYREMVDSANDTILLVEHNRIIECNPAAEQLFGRSRAELIGQHPGDLSPPFQEGGIASMELAQQRIADALSGVRRRFLWRHLRPDGSEFTAEVMLNPAHSLLDDKGLPRQGRFVSIMRDATERLQAEQALKDSAERFQRLFELAPVPLAWLIAVRVGVHWLTTALPLVLATPLLAQLLYLPGELLPVLLVSLLLGTPLLSLLGAVVAALTVGIRRSGMLLALLALPLFLPVLVFGAGSVMAAAQGLPWAGALLLSAGAWSLARRQLPASALLHEHREMLRLEWRNVALTPVAYAETPYRPSVFERLGRASAQTDVSFACAAARRFSGPAYSSSYFLPQADGLGLEVLDMCLPVLAGGQRHALLLAVARQVVDREVDELLADHREHDLPVAQAPLQATALELLHRLGRQFPVAAEGLDLHHQRARGRFRRGYCRLFLRRRRHDHTHLQQQAHHPVPHVFPLEAPPGAHALFQRTPSGRAIGALAARPGASGRGARMRA